MENVVNIFLKVTWVSLVGDRIPVDPDTIQSLGFRIRMDLLHYCKGGSMIPGDLSANCEGDGNEVFIDLQKNDDSYGIPHGTLNKKQTSNQQDSPHLPEFSNKTNLSIRIDVSPYPTHRPNGASPYKRVGVFVKFCFGILIISRRYRGIGESGVFGWGENGKNIFIGSINLYFCKWKWL